MPAIPRVFISATSRDLRSYRQAVADVLLKLGAHPVVQEHFPPDHRLVVEMLRAKIEPCDAVICLVGRVYGHEPSNWEPGEPRRSYTQLEYEIAVDLRKPVFAFIAADDCPFDQPADESEELRGLQVEHLGRLKANDRTRMEFRSREHLTDQVRIMRFDPDRTVRPAHRGTVAGAFGIVGLALALFSWPGHDGQRAAVPTPADPSGAAHAGDPGRNGGHAAAPTPPALSAELSVRVWAPGPGAKRALNVQEPGALPLHAGDWVRLEVRLNQPAHPYLLWLDGKGRAASLYPWLDRKFGERIPDESSRVSLDSPEELDGGWRMKGSAGLETALLLVRRTALPPGTDLASAIGRLPPSPLNDPLEVAVILVDERRRTPTVDVALHREIADKVETIDDPLRQLMERLRPHFEVIKAVRFAYQGE